jgi:4-carboxymuconolactone decarboxylase
LNERPRLSPLSWSSLDEGQREIYQSVIGSRPVDPGNGGPLPGPFNAMLHSPDVGGPLERLGAAVRSTGSIPARAREIATLAVAVHMESDYEWLRHSQIARNLGVSDADLQLLRAAGQPDFPDPLERAVLRVTRILLAKSDLSDDEYEEAIAHLGEAGLVTLSTLVGYYRLLALQLRVFRVGLPVNL